MAFFNFKNVKVAGIAAGVPKNVINNLNSDTLISEHYDNASFVELTGVIERRFSHDLTTSDLCFAAAKQLLTDLKWEPKEIDAIIMVSQTLDFDLPATACIMQDKLGCTKECYAEDIQLGCSGWVYGISNIASLLQNGTIKKALLCVGDARGEYIDRKKSGDPLFGYAGTVTALEYIEGGCGIVCNYGTDGSGYEAIIKYQGGSRIPMDASTFEYYKDPEDSKEYNGLSAHMKGMDVFSFGISTAPKSVKTLAKQFDYDYLDSDYFIFHQANKKMNEMINKKLKLPQEKVPMCMPMFGNTSSASIPLTIVTQLKGNADNGSKVFTCCGFGVGLSWGTVRFVTDNLIISQLVEVNDDEHML